MYQEKMPGQVFNLPLSVTVPLSWHISLRHWGRLNFTVAFNLLVPKCLPST